MAYSLLSDLDTTKDNWLVKVRICRMWEFVNFKRSEEMISLNMVLIDEKGTLIHAVIWKNQVNRFQDKLSEGSVIVIRNFKVAETTGEYRPIQSNLKITFLRITAVQKLQDDIVHIPVNGFQFIQSDMIRSRINNNTVLTDVVGCLCGLGDLESVGSKWKKRDIHILTDPDDRSIKTKITLWEEFGEAFYPYLYPNDSGPYIVIVTATTVKEFRGELNLSTTCASKIYVNLKMDIITSLLQKFTTNSVQVQTIESASGGNIPLEVSMFENRMTITELLDSEWSSDIEECMVTVRAQITEIDKFFDWYYISCNLCNKKIKPTNGVYTCQKCEKLCDFPVVRYKIQIKIKDNGGKTTLVLFNGVTEKLLDISAHKLVNRLSKSDTNIPPEIQSLCGKDFVFKLKLSNFNLKEGLENYTVTKVYEPNEELELQHRRNKDKKGKEKVDDLPEPTIQNAVMTNTDDSTEHVDDNGGASSSMRRVSTRKLKKRRKLLIDDD